MIQTIKNAFQIKDIRKRILLTLFIILLVRIGCQLPLPGINKSVLDQIMAGFMAGNMGFLNALTGSSLSNLSFFALNITVYITASIIIQLLTIAFPALEEMQKDGETGRDKISRITRYLTLGLAIAQSVALVIGFGNQGVFGDLFGTTKLMVMGTDVLLLTSGAMLAMWLGDMITEFGVGNGISLILLANILSTMPGDFITLYNQFIKGAASLGSAILAGCIIIALFVGMIVFIIYLNGAERRIQIQTAKNIPGKSMLSMPVSVMPIKVNTAGVIPIIFAASVMQMPVLISRFFDSAAMPEWTKYITSSFWFNIDNIRYTAGFVLYIAMIIFFAYYYTQVTFNPVEVANNLKKQGSVIPGIRPGKPTEEYLSQHLRYLIFIGAIGMCIVATVPIVVSGLFHTSLSFAGTSLIIVVSVIIETMNRIDSMMIGRNYEGFIRRR